MVLNKANKYMLIYDIWVNIIDTHTVIHKKHMYITYTPIPFPRRA